jgi:hypothetical protein
LHLRLRFRKNSTLAYETLTELQQLLPRQIQVYVLFDRWYPVNRLLKCCHRKGWHVVYAIKSNREQGDKTFSQ